VALLLGELDEFPILYIDLNTESDSRLHAAEKDIGEMSCGYRWISV
jgi:hypothetical protein